MIQIIKNVSVRQWGIFFFLVSAAILAAVFISQFFGFHPCKLCIWQRWPYAATLLISLILIVKPSTGRILLALLMLIFLGEAALAFFHLGVEYHWWTFQSDCVGNGAFTPGASVEEMLAKLKAAPNVKCDDRVPFLFGMTMAFYNVLTALGLSVLSGYSLRSSSLSQ